MSYPSVSFVCTFYNKAPFLPVVLDSIRNQNYPGAVEYVFVDDGSTDDTLERLHTLTAGWDACRIVTQANGGQTAATITGLKLAQHDYIKTWDGDDYAHPDLTRLLVEACEQYAVQFAYCLVDWGLDTDPSQISHIKTWLKDRPIPADAVLQKIHLPKILRGPIVNPTGALFKRSILSEAGLPDPRVVIVDTYIPYAAALFTDFAFIPSKLAFAFPNVPGRLTENEAQIMHDLNASLACYYDNFFEKINYTTKLFIGRRATSRARNWVKRNHKKSLFSRYGLSFLRALIPFPMTRSSIFATCKAFRQGNAYVRVGVDAKRES